MDKKERIRLTKQKYCQTQKGKKSNMINHWKRKGIIDDDLGAVYDVYIKETKCWICQNKFKNTKDRCLDHDHDSGEIRYICCQYCNRHLLNIPEIKPRKNNNSGHLGICYDEEKDRYKYQKMTNGKKYRRFFKTKEEAIACKLKYENANHFQS